MTVKGRKWPGTAKGSCLHCLAGRSRCSLADSSYTVLKSVKIKQTLHYSVLLIEFSSSLPFTFFYSEWSYTFFSSFLSGVELVMEYNFKYCRGLKLLYYEWSMLKTVPSPLLVGSKKNQDNGTYGLYFKVCLFLYAFGVLLW